MKTARSKDGTILSYDVYGSGAPLVFIAGAICFRKFGPIVKDVKTFANEFTVYNYDRRGRGDSTNTKPYSLDKEVDDIEAIIDAAGGSAFVYGHSSGAVLALEAALRMPHKVKKLVMFDPPYVHDDAEKKDYARLKNEVGELLKKDKNAAALKCFLGGIGMPKVFVHVLPLMPGWATMKALAPTLTYDMQMTSDLPPLGRAAQVKVPTLVLYGGKSAKGIHTVAKQLSQAIPKSQLSELPGQDHMASAKVVLPHLSSFYKA